MSHLKEMFAKQGDFSLLVRNLKERDEQVRGQETPERLMEWSRTYILAAHAELSEMLETVPQWKPHRRNPVSEPFNRYAFLEEGVDVFNYLLSALLLADIDPEEFYQVWRGKLDVLEQRFLQEVTAPLVPGEPAVMLDIDGVLADYRSGLLRFYEEASGTQLPADPGEHYELEREIGIKPEEYRQLKEDFNEQGGLRVLPRFGSARDLMIMASKLGRVLVVSSREGDSDRRVYRDTLFWLKTTFPEYQFFLHFTRNKSDWIRRTGVNLLAAVEDEPKTALRLGHEFPEAKVLVPALGYNESLWNEKSVSRLSTKDIVSELESMSFRDPEAPEPWS